VNRKASIQLSVNFLVILIISIVILGLGFVLVNRMVGTGDDKITQMDDRLRVQIENLLVRENRLVAIPTVEKNINRGKGDFFGIGVMNLEIEKQFFKVNLTFHEAYRKNGEIMNIVLSTPSQTPNSWIKLVEKEPFEIKGRDKYVFSAGIQVPKQNVIQGLYVFNVSVTNGTNNNIVDCFDNYNDCYDKSIHKLYVLVN
jgi:hypothetical protein